MVNKIIVSKYIEEKDESGFYAEMISDRNTADLLRSNEFGIAFGAFDMASLMVSKKLCHDTVTCGQTKQA